MRRPLISLGDMLRVVKELTPRDNETEETIRRMLGLEREVAGSEPLTIGAWKPSSSENEMIARHRASRPRISIKPSTTETGKHPIPPRPAIESTIKQVRKAEGRFTPPAWLHEIGAPLDPAESGAVPPAPPLFPSIRFRGILTAALATALPEGEIDLERILPVVGQGIPLSRLPRLPNLTLRRGVQVLIDLSPGMDPFRQDQQSLMETLGSIFSDDRLSVLSFAGCPDRGAGAGPRKEWTPWKPPPVGMPVLAVTDLGIGGPILDDDRAIPGEWIRFAGSVRAKGHPLLALVPYEALRWPPRLSRAMTLIHWSERTTAGEIRRAMRDARYRLK